MMQVSTVRKFMILARLARQHAGRSQTVNAAVRAGRVTMAHFTRVLHILWLEVIGFVFLGIAVIGGYAFFREYSKFQAGQIGIGRALLAAGISVMFGWFGLSSFWRARGRS
jgi:hypothetical protein